MANESALVVLIPEAEPLVQDFRKLYDPSAAWGVPAHVTILYPFIPPQDITPEVFVSLKEIFSSYPTFSVKFAQTMDFPDTLFLAPEPADPFIEMTKAVVRVFPEYPPYSGGFSEIVPHLTIAQMGETEKMVRIRSDFLIASKGKLPFTARVDSVTLIDDLDGPWQIRQRFALTAG